MITKKFEEDFIKKNSVLDTKLKILRAAAVEFSQKGYKGSSIRNIAACAKVPHSSVTYHFGNKEELFRTVIGNLFNETFEIASSFDIGNDPKKAEEAFEAHLKKVAWFYFEHPEFLMIIHRESIDRDEPLLIFEEEFGKLKKVVREHLKIGQDVGLFKDIPLDHLQMLFSGAFQSLFVSSSSNIRKVSNSQVRQKINDHVKFVIQLLKK